MDSQMQLTKILLLYMVTNFVYSVLIVVNWHFMVEMPYVVYTTQV